MKKEKRFCSFCSNPLTKDDIEGKVRDCCPNCKTVFFENPLPVACCIVVNEKREVLLVRRKKDPYEGMWCLPIGFAETGEEVRDAAIRELHEEAGVWGQTVRLIDVDTVDNYFYGYLAIVTYEVCMTGGTVRPGDDAIDAAFFPIHKLPPLAWSSNEKAIEIYIALYKDEWAVIDSFKYLFPEVRSIQEVIPQGHWQEALLSNALVKIIDKDIDEINDYWIREMTSSSPGLLVHSKLLTETNRLLLRGLQYWLRRDYDSLNLDIFTERGDLICMAGISLPELLLAISLSRKSIWRHVVKKRLFSSPLEIYTALELNNRIIFFYDKVNTHLTTKYDILARSNDRLSR
jgi:8-oxo-dGTP diphosphatase